MEPEAINQDHVERYRGTTCETNLKIKTSMHASSSIAREDFKQSMLAKAAKDRDRLICKSENSKNSKSISSTKDGQEKPNATDRVHGMGYEPRRVAITSLPERAAILRLLAS